MAFPPLGNYVVVSVSIDFPSYSPQDAPFHHIVYDYSGADWDGLCDHLKDVTLSVSAATFPDCWKVSSVVLEFKNAGETSTAKNYHPDSLLSVVSKAFEKLVNNKCWSPREMWPFSDFRYGFRSSRSTADLLTVVFDKIPRACNRSGATQAIALARSKAFDKVWHAGILHKLKSYGISGQIFGLISSFLSNRQLRVVLDGKYS